MLLNFLEVLCLGLISLRRVDLLLIDTLDLKLSETLILNTLHPLLELVEFYLEVGDDLLLVEVVYDEQNLFHLLDRAYRNQPFFRLQPQSSHLVAQ